MNKKRIYLISLGILIILALAGGISTTIFTPEGKDVYMLIPEKATMNDVVDSLKSTQVNTSTALLSIEAKLSGYSHRIKAGRYKIHNGMHNLFLLNNLLKGRQEPVKLSFNNIRTKNQLCERLSNELMVDSVSLYKLLCDTAFLSQYDLTPDNAVSIFIPNTYELYWNTDAKKLIKRMYDESEKFWTKERLAKAEKLKLSKAEIVTLASIVEEESNRKSEKPSIAGLYLNRLHIGMKLQADPTIKFALNDFSLKRIKEKHIFACQSSPYNTYLHIGLPPGPIRIPGIESIDAVLNYKSHDYLFMCVDPTKGEHFFTKSYEEHKAMAGKYQQSLDKRGIQ